MLGNVWERVEDFHNEKILPDTAPPQSGKVHVLKGGSFTSDVVNATFFFHGGGPGNGFDVGFRLVMERVDVTK
ncbi:MAG: SUMF1/EgtB/PvdO family nonheme iron enzyme [Cyclobacteriaceae bacterium]